MSPLDETVAALCLWREARGASLQAKAGVFSVILNRASDPHNRWPKMVCDVVTQPKQFSSFNADDPNVTQWPTPRHAQDWAAWLDCMVVVTTAVGGDSTNGATNYYSGDAVPYWAEGKEPSAEIGPFKFFKL